MKRWSSAVGLLLGLVAWAHADGVGDSHLLSAAQHRRVERWLDEATSHAGEATKGGFRVATAPASVGRFHPTDRRVSLEVDGSSPEITTIEVEGRGRVVVRRAKALRAARLEAGSVIATSTDGKDAATFFARELGVEELVRLEIGERSLDYQFDLPQGNHVAALRDRPGLIEVTDTTGHPWLRMRADAAWEDDGTRRVVDVVVDRARVQLRVRDALGAVVLDPTWQDVGAPIEMRDDPGSAVLPDGRVLLAGGLVDSNISRSAEAFDPDTQTFSVVSGLHAARAYLAVSPLRDGRTLFAGGTSRTPPASCSLTPPRRSTR